jgi:outer membrane protein
MKNYLLTFAVAISPLARITATESSITLLLSEIEVQALASSHNAKALNAEIDAAKNKTEALHSLLYPKLVLDANYKYISEVPTLNLPGGAHSAFGDNNNYSIGPVLSWTVWDFGSTQKSLKGAVATEISKESEKKLTTRQTLLAARLAYFKVQLRQEQLRLVTDSLKLAESQYRDIQNRVSVGSSTRIDLLSAHKEVLNFKIQSRQIQSDLSSDLRDLYAIAGLSDSTDFSRPVNIDPISSSLMVLSKYENIKINKLDLDQHPLIKMYTSNAESMRAMSESFSANKLPKISLYAKSSIDYPNGPILEKFNQNTIGINLTMPIFENGRSTHEASEKQNLAIASENRREQARIDLFRDWQKSKDQLKGLQDKVDIYKKAVTESEEQARLVYSSYRFGRSSFLEVQSSNLHSLEVKVQSTTNDVQILIQLASLASISEEY